jgi:hypothetical protein
MPEFPKLTDITLNEDSKSLILKDSGLVREPSHTTKQHPIKTHNKSQLVLPD